ncbi:MAG TPA: hypothetical protein VI564_02595 [Candidatus Nanoarchaeia archaeon]|nr:hypothetical protein [Candidatus Nanoarchaeia archaeon]
MDKRLERIVNEMNPLDDFANNSKFNCENLFEFDVKSNLYSKYYLGLKPIVRGGAAGAVAGCGYYLVSKLGLYDASLSDIAIGAIIGASADMVQYIPRIYYNEIKKFIESVRNSSNGGKNE